ncbi:MAG: ABC transporter substrate-binding protein [Salinigranum sp.]
MRIVTLLPSATEIVCALGLDPVGVSHECSYPPRAAEKPSVNRCLVDAEASCGDVDERVRAAAEEHGSVYEIDGETLLEADPDLIVTQGVCDVCAVDRVLVEEAVADLGLDAEILTTDVHGLEDLLADVRRIGAAAGAEARADDLVARLRGRIERVERTAADAGRTPRVTVLDWLEPAMVAGHWIPEMVDLVGGEYGIAEPGGYSEPTEWQTVREFDPEVLIAAPCGFPLHQTLEHVDELTDRDGWDALSAVRNGRAYAMEGDAYVNCPGPRLVDTLEHLAGLVHPDSFDRPPADVSRPIAARRSA